MSIDIPTTANAAGAATVPITGIALDLTGATQYGRTFAVTDLTQDGYAPAAVRLSIERERRHHGELLQRPVQAGRPARAGQLPQPAGPAAAGRQHWAPPTPRATRCVGTPGQGNLGVLQSGALEESNVDLTAELVNMITAQRIYQANAQTIKTQDQVMQTLVNLR